MPPVPVARAASSARPHGQARAEARAARLLRRASAATILAAAALAGGGLVSWRPAKTPGLLAATAQEAGGTSVAAPRELVAEPVSLAAAAEAQGLRAWFRNASRGLTGFERPCAVAGATCNCVGTLTFSTLLGVAVREVNSDGEVTCSAEALGSKSHRDLRMCWCQDGVAWGDEVRKGLASMVRSGLVPRVEIASAAAEQPNCSAESDGFWHGCVMLSRRWDTTVVPQVMVRAAPPEEQLDMSLRKLDACHRLAPGAALRVVGVRSGQGADALEMPVAMARVCSVVWTPEAGVNWTAKTSAMHCATQPGTCTTTPCECRRASDTKLELKTPQGRRCWACAEAGKEYQFRVNALAEQMEGSGVSWWPPYGINCPPILWMFMDWRAVMEGCPVISGFMVLFFVSLLVRRMEEVSGVPPWTRVAPLFGPTLKRGEVWRFFTFTLFHLQFLELFQNALTFLDTLDVEGTPAIVLGDGSNLKCGVGAKQNFMCYPSIGIGSYHTLCAAIISVVVGGMCSTWVQFKAVVTGASALGFGLSGAIVALYALYAGAELDQSTSVQRSFQDWVWLRLIFVAFHVVMEWIRGLSQRDAAGLFAHTASFAAGFAYVLYFLPPMGDGSLLPSDRPYVVPCAYDLHSGEFADSSVPECVRLFSQLYEYQVPALQHSIYRLFLATVSFTVFNVVVLQKRVPSSEAMLLGGLEVSAVCCSRRAAGPGGQQPSWRSSNMEGKSIILWCEVIGAKASQVPQECLVEVRCLGSDPRREAGRLLEAEAEASGCTRGVEGSDGTSVWRESVFLPVQFKRGSFVQLVLRDAADAQKPALCQAALPMQQALRFGSRRDFNEQKLKLEAVGSAAGAPRAVLHLRFRCLDVGELARLRKRVKDNLDQDRYTLAFIQRQVRELQQRQEEAPAGASGDNATA